MLSLGKCLTGGILVVLFMVARVRSDAQFPKLEHTKRGLEAVASGTSLTSGIRSRDLMGLIEEYETASEADKAEINKDPINRLIRDFVIVPSARFKNDLRRNKEFFAANMVRIQEAYKRFKPGYLGQGIENFSCYLKIPKLNNLYKKLKTNKPTTIGEWLPARIEAFSYRQRVAELVEHEDIYHQQNELKNIMNMLNWPPLRILIENVLPTMTENSDPKELHRLYSTLLKQSGYMFYEGKLVQMYRVRGEPAIIPTDRT